MAISNNQDLTQQFKQNVYRIYQDLSGWDRFSIQPIGMTNPLYVYGTNNPNSLLGVREGNAQLASDHVQVQVTNLTTGTAGTSITTAGLYKGDVNFKFLRVSGGGADVYRLFLHLIKID